MALQKATVNLKNGLQARAAASFVQQANRYAADVFIEMKNCKVSAKSIMGIMSLALGMGSEIAISAVGPDADEAVNNLKSIVEKEAV
ncbi:HPr family phosphocarrier protein [Ammoniphilus sp. 3BR4]|uniref:HPr family phosphocarrier protein n=1 Tax=Ammoniphilus sp. 3BR4 TaxID=3158265 RepID=UPI00346652A1